VTPVYDWDKERDALAARDAKAERAIVRRTIDTRLPTTRRRALSAWDFTPPLLSEEVKGVSDGRY